ncbi:hypothetical protein Spp001_44 [Shewanella phage Spp001]|uniref:Uncharacterized protein n=1 Tax=Shewanella phage Spp001 TaxID=1445859 RepID=W6E8F6_9CAUD|nr:hypothetical protein Spp001_44 [Shewanella phage Spp001]AHJ10552.1 hypothetical protein Spp001_44 [Shewanella phage Spp001]
MVISKLRKLYPNLKFESGHDMCHPETCSCWNIRIYDDKNINLFNCDSGAEAIRFCEKFNAGLWRRQA